MAPTFEVGRRLVDCSPGFFACYGDLHDGPPFETPADFIKFEDVGVLFSPPLQPLVHYVGCVISIEGEYISCLVLNLRMSMLLEEACPVPFALYGIPRCISVRFWERLTAKWHG